MLPLLHVINIYMDTDKKKKKKSIHENTLKSLKQDATLVFSVAAASPALTSCGSLVWTPQRKFLIREE